MAALLVSLIYLILLLGLLTCFGVPVLAEFRTGRKGAERPLRIIEIAVGMIITAALPSGFWGLLGLSPAKLSWTMVCVSLLMGGMALFSKYSSRVALGLVLTGYGSLMGLWYFNGAYHDVTDDRTASIVWKYEWDIEDPTDQITEKFWPGSVPKQAIFFPPAVGPNGTIYLLRPHSAPDGLSLVAFDPDWLWEIMPKGGVCTLPAIADDGTILFGSGAENGDTQNVLSAGQGLAWSVSPGGQKKWTYKFPSASFIPVRDFGGGSVEAAKSPACSQPAIAADGTSYWLGHGVYALTSAGALLWAFNPGEDFYAVAIGEDGTVYGLADGALFALAPDGTQKWKYTFETSKYFEGNLAVGADGAVYFRVPGSPIGSALLALTPQGTLKWRNESHFFQGAPLVTSDGTIYEDVKDTGNEDAVAALGPDGKDKWSTPLGSNMLQIASDGTLYICYVRDLFAISPRGRMLWKAQLPENPDILAAHDPTKAVSLAPNGKFYIGDFLGRLGTFDAPTGLATSGWPARFHDVRNTARAGAH